MADQPPGLKLLSPTIPPQSTEPTAEQKYDHYWDEKRKREELEAEATRKAIRGIPTKRYLNVQPKPWQGGLLYGPAGSGKTHEAIARLSSCRGIFYEVAEFIEDARDVELGRASDFQERRQDTAFECGHLVLDDLGARRPTPFAVDAVLRLIQYRWKHEKPTLVTSNLTPTELASLWDERIASRISGFGPMEEIAGRDRRAGNL